jgi:hypothetical protein
MAKAKLELLVLDVQAKTTPELRQREAARISIG